MRPLYGYILFAIGILGVGLIVGTGSLLFVPILGFVAIIALIVWGIGRRAQGKPPVE